MSRLSARTLSVEQIWSAAAPTESTEKSDSETPSSSLESPMQTTKKPASEAKMVIGKIGKQTTGQGSFEVAAARLMAHMKAKGVEGLLEEYKDIKNAPYPASMTTAISTANAERNRYQDVPCWDQTRVALLEPTSDDLSDPSDFVHASWVDGLVPGDREFICTQGPRDNTVEDFWRLVWEQRVSLVLMLCLTREADRPKCADYYKTEPGQSMDTEFGLTITTVSKTPVQEGEHRLLQTHLRLSRPHLPTRTLVHILHCNWPDRTLPPSSAPLVQVIRRVRNIHNSTAKDNAFTQPTPKLVHCSAGVGRTGTYIAIHVALAHLEAGLPLSISALVRRIRLQRRQSVQTPEQYVFVYLCLAEFISTRLPKLSIDLTPIRALFDSL